MTFMISIGEYAGFYIFKGFTKRICLGWVSFTYIPLDDAGLCETKYLHVP